MAKGYVIYNPLAGAGDAFSNASLLQIFTDGELEYYDITRITNYGAFIGGMEREDYLVIVGGDGTLNRFVNDTDTLKISQEIFYFPTGTGNDFAKDLGMGENPGVITQNLKNLPTVEVNGKKYRFINGVGFGLDGYCCYVGDKLRKIPGKEVNYTGIAIKGLLNYFTPRNAKITVDGKEYAYKKVWIAPTMLGRYYGGGMMPTPKQNRTSGKLSVMVFHGAGRFRTLCVFPSIFQGKHIKHTKMVAVHTGREITVEFDQPTALQIDGETVLGVTQYTACAGIASEQGNKTSKIIAESLC